MPLTPAFTAKAALIRQVRRQGTTQEELARRMGIRDREAVDILRPNMASPMSRLTLALQTTGRRLVLEDLPEEPGEHFHEPAGQTPMDDLEFIRRLRRYAVHQNIQWVMVDNDPEPGCTILMESRRARLPEEKLTTQELTNIMKNLGIITREF